MDLSALFAGLPGDTLRTNEPMSKHTSFRVGGAADLMIIPKSKEQACLALEISRKYSLKHYVMGNGTNLLVRDEGYRGVIIKLGEGLGAITVDGCVVNAEAGATLSRIASAAMSAGLTGFEFASGIPGSLGGAISMNAGAYGSEIKDVLTCAEVAGNVFLTNSELEFSYRSSRVQSEGLTVLAGRILLQRGKHSEISARTKELNDRRRDKQPLEFSSAGSTFKRPPGRFAGKLIADAGLAGFSIGGARVSEKHCGFIINTGGASANDILELMAHVQTTVKNEFGIWLEPEVRIPG